MDRAQTAVASTEGLEAATTAAERLEGQATSSTVVVAARVAPAAPRPSPAAATKAAEARGTSGGRPLAAEVLLWAVRCEQTSASRRESVHA